MVVLSRCWVGLGAKGIVGETDWVDGRCEMGARDEEVGGRGAPRCLDMAKIGQQPLFLPAVKGKGKGRFGKGGRLERMEESRCSKGGPFFVQYVRSERREGGGFLGTKARTFARPNPHTADALYGRVLALITLAWTLLPPPR